MVLVGKKNRIKIFKFMTINFSISHSNFSEWKISKFPDVFLVKFKKNPSSTYFIYI